MAERLNYQCKFEKYKEELIRLRRHFHRHPELGLQEFETSAFIQEYLGKLGYRFRIVEPTGIIAEHPCQDEAAFAGKKKVVLRAEMDALPIQEQTGLSYASENAGVMHACGHDGIVASALVLARILAEEGEVFPVRMRFLFEPAEEIGEGAHKFDVEKFGCEWGYTMDGGEVGELEFENFNAAAAKITFKGRNVHPGYAKDKMINSIYLANQFITMLPSQERPEHTTGYEGFYHLIGIQGDVEQSTVSYIIRDHDRAKFENRKKEIERLVAQMNAEYGAGTATLELRDQYYNMREKIEPVMHIIDTAFAAMEAVGVKPNVKPIRGGTDGAQLSFKGLPCPNIFAGGLNFHGRYEFVPIQNMEKAMKVIVKIAELVASK